MKKPLFLLSILTCFSSFSQVFQPDTYLKDYYHLLQLQNEGINAPITLNPSIITHHQPDSALQWNIWGDRFTWYTDKKIEIINPVVGIHHNWVLPRGYNDGPQWKGKGFNSFVSAGVAGQFGVVHFTFNPIFYHAQNKSFHIPTSEFNKNQFQYPFVQRIDLVDRFGEDPLYKFHPGQSEARVIYKNWTAGISTQNMTIGPSQIFPILMSKQAGGIPHLDLGTIRPIKTRIGRVEVRSLWGMMLESNYFDTIASNNRRYLAGFTFGYEPSFIKGLSLGVHRMMYRTWEKGDLSVKDTFFQFGNFARKADTQVGQSQVTNDAYDGMASITMRWKFPSVGFEVYGEYAKNDFPGDLRELIQLPDRARAYMWGVAKTIELPNHHVFKILLEETKLGYNKVALLVPQGSARFYIHHIIQQGYTNEGQLVGAGIGPGSSANTLKLNYYYPMGMVGLEFHRIRFNDDYFLDRYAGARRAFPQEYEYGSAIRAVRFFRSFSMEGHIAQAKHRNWYYDQSRDAPHWEFGFQLSYIIK